MLCAESNRLNISESGTRRKRKHGSQVPLATTASDIAGLARCRVGMGEYCIKWNSKSILQLQAFGCKQTLFPRRVVSTLTSILTDMAIPAYQELGRSEGVNASLELFYDIGVFFIALHFDKLYNGSSFTNYIIPHLIFPTNPSSDDVLMIVKNILPQRYEFRNLDSVVHMSQSGVCDQYNRIVRPLLKFYLLYFKTSTPSRSLVFPRCCEQLVYVLLNQDTPVSRKSKSILVVPQLPAKCTEPRCNLAVCLYGGVLDIFTELWYYYRQYKLVLLARK